MSILPPKPNGPIGPIQTTGVARGKFAGTPQGLAARRPSTVVREMIPEPSASLSGCRAAKHQSESHGGKASGGDPRDVPCLVGQQSVEKIPPAALNGSVETLRPVTTVNDRVTAAVTAYLIERFILSVIWSGHKSSAKLCTRPRARTP